MFKVFVMIAEISDSKYFIYCLLCLLNLFLPPKVYWSQLILHATAYTRSAQSTTFHLPDINCVPYMGVSKID